MTIKTSTGFECDVNPNVLDDAELIEALVDIMSGSATSLPMATLKILGKEAKKRLFDHCRTEDGRVPFGRLDAELGEILKELKKDNGGKNS